METKKLDEYGKRLERERILLLAEIKRNEKPTDFGSDTDHLDEETDESEEFGNQLAVANDLKTRLGDIDIALGKIRSHDYGLCEECGKAIEFAVLDIDPESRFCKHCKSKK